MQDKIIDTGHRTKAKIWISYAIWAASAAGLILLIQFWLHSQYNPNHTPRIQTATNGQKQLLLKRNRQGHYLSTGKINGQEALFLLDTGATDVIIPAKLAERYKLALHKPQQVMTANGKITVYSTRLANIELGPLELQNIQASINPHMNSNEILLGMSFLKHIKFAQHQDELILSLP